MSTIGYGPLWRVDGPPPTRRPYGLLQAAEAATQGVRLVTDTDPDGRERWINGIEMYPYPVDEAGTFDTCAATAGSKDTGADVPRPQFGALTVYLPITCTAYRIWDQAEFRSRAVAALAAVEGTAIEREFLAGDQLLLNPHLADGQGAFPIGNFSTTLLNGVALLENQIATQGAGRIGLIHMSPASALHLSYGNTIHEDRGVLKTVNGTVIVPGAGYAAGAHPAGHPAATGTQEWIYASGPVDIRRSDVFTIPDNVTEALDRAQNEITYRAERYYLTAWDTAIQAAVLVDHCLSSC